MRRLTGFAFGFGLAALLSAAGCEQKVPKEEMGKVIFEVPKVPGADEPLKLPQLEGMPKEEKAADAVKGK